MRTLVVAVVVLAVSSCSLIKAQAPAADYAPPADPKCSDSRAYPVVDVVLTGLSALSATGLFIASGRDQSTSSGATVGVGIGSVALAGLFGFSAYRGFSSASQCDSAMGAQRAEVKARPLAGARLRITNASIESIVMLDVAFPLSDDKSIPINMRVNAGETTEVEIVGRNGLGISIGGTVTTLGVTHPVGPINDAFRPGGTFELTVDFDVAMGRYRISGRWAD